MSLLLKLLAGNAALQPIDDIVALIAKGKITHQDAAALVAVRDAADTNFDNQAAAEAKAIGGSYRKGRPMYSR